MTIVFNFSLFLNFCPREVKQRYKGDNVKNKYNTIRPSGELDQILDLYLTKRSVLI